MHNTRSSSKSSNWPTKREQDARQEVGAAKAGEARAEEVLAEMQRALDASKKAQEQSEQAAQSKWKPGGESQRRGRAVRESTEQGCPYSKSQTCGSEPPPPQ